MELVRIADELTKASYDIAVSRYGNPVNPTLVCVHGLTRNSQDFKFLADALIRDFYVLCPDIPGRGKSPWLQHAALYNNGFYAGLLEQWFQQENLGAVHFLGTSMGGLIGMVLAATKPKRIKSFVINDIGSFISKSVLEKLRDYIGLNMESDDKEALSAIVTNNLAGFDIQDAKILSHFVNTSIEPNPNGGYRLAYDPAIRNSLTDATLQDIDLRELWNLVQCPTLIIRGEKSDFLPMSVAEAMQEGQSNSSIITISGAAHAPHLSSPEQIQLVQKWLLTQR